MATITASILFFSNTQTFLIFSSLIGFFSQLKEVPESVFLQETVDENQLVHVYSVFEVISTLAFSVFVFLMSSITEKFWNYNKFLAINNLHTFRSWLDLS